MWEIIIKINTKKSSTDFKNLANIWMVDGNIRHECLSINNLRSPSRAVSSTVIGFQLNSTGSLGDLKLCEPLLGAKLGDMQAG